MGTDRVETDEESSSEDDREENLERPDLYNYFWEEEDYIKAMESQGYIQLKSGCNIDPSSIIINPTPIPNIYFIKSNGSKTERKEDS